MANYPIHRIRDLAVEERPREKLKQSGVSSLSNSELLAILINTGTPSWSAIDLAREILSQTGNDLHIMARMNLQDFKRIKGIGPAKAMRIMSAFELARRKNLTRPGQRIQIRSSEDAYRILEGCLTDLAHEEFWILLLNRANQLIDKQKISQGGITGTVTDVRMILRAALDKLASGLILAHNHPSGNLEPSKADLEITRKIKEAARLMDVSLLDHLIISDQGYRSLADENLLQ